MNDFRLHLNQSEMILMLAAAVWGVTMGLAVSTLF